MNEEIQTISQAVSAASNREGKYLTFFLVGEEYGIGILKIKEIIGMMSITTVPQTPEFVKGVINLRGKVIPVIDLRLRFAMEENDYTERTCIIVVEIGTQADTVQIGIVVDAVSEVLNIKSDEIADNFHQHMAWAHGDVVLLTVDIECDGARAAGRARVRRSLINFRFIEHLRLSSRHDAAGASRSILECAPQVDANILF